MLQTMASIKFSLSLFLLSCIGTIFAGNALIWPAEWSHWINMKSLLNELTNRGNKVTVLIHTSSPYIDPSKPSSYDFVVFDVPFKSDAIDKNANKFLKLWMYESVDLSYWQLYKEVRMVLSDALLLQRQVCDGILKNNTLLEKLRAMKFDVLVSDPVQFCSELVAEKLGIPFLYSLRFSIASSMERFCGQMPSVPSYVPAALVAFTDRMAFAQRLKNLLFYIVYDYLFFQVAQQEWDSYYTENLGKPTTLCETMGKAEMWLIRTYWDFEYPRPYLPNFEFVGGLHCQPAKPLPEELEEFVQSSGDDGIVVFSLGSMIKNLTKEKANVIASALAQIPQKVLWRYSGESPDTLGPNTKLLDWLPQNDLLGHPKTKLFITHGGTNGIYEAIYHGVPMVGIPLFADQPDNMVHMKAKGAAEVVDFTYLKTQDLLEAINKVISDAKYKESAMKLSQIQHDQPVKPLDRAVFWIEFVMRHKGAKHLRPASHNLTWYQYHCLDVISFLLFCLAAALFITVKCCILCFRKSVRLLGTKDKRE